MNFNYTLAQILAQTDAALTQKVADGPETIKQAGEQVANAGQDIAAAGTDSFSGILDTLTTAFTKLGTDIINFLPKLIISILILIVGFLIAKLVQKVTTTILSKVGLDHISEKIGMQSFISRMGPEATLSKAIGTIGFWLMMFAFLITSSEVLQVQAISQGLKTFVGYVPNLMAAGVILIGGSLLGNFLKNMVHRSGEAMGAELADPMSKVIFGFVMIMVFLTAMRQLIPGTDLAEDVVKILLAASGFGLALALGMGTRDLASQIISGLYARDLLTPGSTVTVEETTGTLKEVGTISTRVETADGESIYVPNKDLVGKVVKEKK